MFFRWMSSGQFDCPTHCLRAVKFGGSTLDDTRFINGVRRNPSPVDPATEWIVQRNAIEYNHRAAGATRAGASQRNTLCSWIGAPTRISPKEGESWDLAQRGVKIRGWSARQFRAVEL